MMERDAEVQRRSPIVPFGAMDADQRTERDPWHSQRIGYDGAIGASLSRTRQLPIAEMIAAGSPLGSIS
jgi:hypothetical protein